MKIRRHQVIIAALIILGITFLVIGVFLQKDPIKYYAHSLRNWQEADSVAGYPIALNGNDEGSPIEFFTAEFQPNLSTMSAMERFRLPTAHGFVKPTAEEARAAGTGLVLYTGDPKGYPGKAVLLGHRLPDGSIMQTFYTGLESIEVRVGRLISRGTSLGKGGRLLEVRAGAAIDITMEEIAGIVLNSQNHPSASNRIPLDDFFASHGVTNPSPDPLGIMLEKEAREARGKLGIGVE